MTDMLEEMMRDLKPELLCPNFKGSELELEKYRPQKGSPVEYLGKPWGIVTRVEDSICYVKKHNGEHSLFIWKFYNSTANGLNNLMTWGCDNALV